MLKLYSILENGCPLKTNLNIYIVKLGNKLSSLFKIICKLNSFQIIINGEWLVVEKPFKDYNFYKIILCYLIHEYLYANYIGKN